MRAYTNTWPATAIRAALAAAVLLPKTASASGAPPNWHLDAGAIATSCHAQIATMRARVRAIERARSARTFDTVILPLENATADLNDALAAQTFLGNVAVDPGVRDASFACQTSVADALAEIQADPLLAQAVNAAAASGTAQTVADRKLAQLWVTSIRRSGAALPATQRAEFVARTRELDDLETRFAKNLASDASTIEIGRRELGGLPADLLATSNRASDGSYTVAVNESTLSVLSDSTDEAVRKRFYLVYENRAASLNVPLLERAIAVRDRLAHLAGYESWADFQLADRMAGTTARAQKFLAGVATGLQPATQSELDAMRTALDRERGGNGALQPWDVRRAEYLVSKAHAVDPEAIRQYFPVAHTIDAILDIYHTLLGVDFTAVTPVDAWAPGVLEYRVTDSATHKLLGITYFDLYPRPGKFEHFANFPILPVRTIGGSHVPIAAIVGNWPQPAPGQPALLSHDDVVTFFHEFGHDMAALLATAPYETLSEGFREDFVEAPSQMLENFAWQPSILERVSSNVQTGAPMPSDLIAKLVASRSTDDAYEMTRLVTLSTIDLAYHSSGPHVDTTAVWNAIAGTMDPLLVYPGTHPQVAFGHLMGGYDAGLYAYPWAKVYAQDLFTAFAANPLDPAVGMRYRVDILAPARTIEPDEEVRAFLGRPMDPSAFYAEFATPSPAP